MNRLIATFGVLFVTTCAFAQEAPPAAAPAAPAATADDQTEHLKAVVTGVEGLVQVREAEDKPWQKATMGMEVGEDAEFRTGPKSAVRFTIPPDQTITLDRLGTVKVVQAINDKGVIKTQLGMKYGRTRYDIEAAGREHEASIASPSNTLAVRGTKFSSYDQRPFTAQAVSLTGRVQSRNYKKNNFAFGGKNAGKTVITSENGNAASLALDRSVVDPSSSLARSASERPLLNNLLSSGATVGFDYEKGIRTIRGGKVPSTDAELIPTLPGVLNFVLRWSGNADLNMGIGSPGSQTLYPIAGLNYTSNGGKIPFDHRGGANGGVEVGYWPANFPTGIYSVGSVHISGPNTPATLDVFRDGQRIPITAPDGSTVQTVNYIAAPVDPAIADGQVVGFVRISPPAGAVAASAKTTKAAANKPAANKAPAKAVRAVSAKR